VLILIELVQLAGKGKTANDLGDPDKKLVSGYQPCAEL
jgi:hypothetical protein